jgi:hypothetical protein
MFCGSCFGIVTWAFYMQWVAYVSRANNFIVLDITDPNSQSQKMAFFALFAYWRAAFSVTYPIEFMCMSVAKLMVLDRMSDFLSLQAGDTKRRWVVAARAVMAAVVLGNLSGIAASWAAAAQLQPVVALCRQASDEFGANNTETAMETSIQSTKPYKTALSTLSYQAFFEVAVLLLIVVAFAAVGLACVRIIGSMPAPVVAVAAVDERKQLRLQIVGTTSVVFVTFLTRSIYSTMFALAALLQNFDKSECDARKTCDVCYNVYSHIEVWFKRTPEFVLMVVLVTKPLPLLVALWGMTSPRLRQLMQQPNQHTALLLR